MDGRFAFQGREFENAAVTLQVRAEGHALLLSGHFLETAPLDVGDLALLEGGRLCGRVIDPGDRGLPLAEVRLLPIGVHPLTRVREKGEVPPATTDAAGGFTFEHVMPGTYRLEASAPDRQRFIHREPILIEDCGTQELEPIQLDAGFRLVGRVFDPRGMPVTGAVVRVRSEDPTQRFDERLSTDGDGRFATAHVPGAPQSVRVSADGFLGWEATGIDPELGRSLVVRLEEGLRIRGTVVEEETGKPVEKFSLKIHRRGPLRIREEDLAQRPGGTFLIEGLDEGEYTVEVRSPNHQVMRSGTISLSRSTGSQSLQLDLQDGLRVEGIVVDGDRGRPLPGVRVELTTGSEPAMSVRTDADGRFAFRNTAPGEYVVTARLRERGTADIGPLQIAVDREDLRIEIGRTASLRGRVRGIPPRSDGVVVLVIDGAVIRAARSEPDGSYEIRGLQPGDYAVRAVYEPVRLSPVGLRVPRSIDPGTLTVDVTLRAGERRVFDPVVADTQR